MSRVILSMTSIPDRIGTLDATIESIQAQTCKPDEVCMFAVDTVCNDFFARYVTALGVSNIAFRKVEDRGPVTKLSVLQEHWLRDDDIIVTIDDDIVYEPTWLETLVDGANKNPDKAVGFSGWNTYEFIRAWKENDPKGGDYVFPNIPGPCDVLEGWAGVAYRRKFFYIDPVMGFASVLHPLPMFRNVDDVWIAWHLHRRGFGRTLIGPRLAKPRENSLPGLHDREDFVDLNRKAAIVAFNGVNGDE